VQTHVEELSLRLVKMGMDIEVLTTDPTHRLRDEEVVRGVRVRRFKSWAPNDSYYFSPSLKKYLARNSNTYDIVHVHNYHALPALYGAQTKKSSCLVFTPRYHGSGHTYFRNLLHIPYKYFGRSIFDKADKVICLSKHERDIVLSNFKLRAGKLVLIPNGISKQEFVGLRKTRDTHRSNILCVSRLEKYKGIDWLIKVLPRLDTSVSLQVVGSGPHKRSLMQLSRRLALQDRVEFHSNLDREELLQLYSNANVFVLLSTHEAFGNAVAEALASGTHCIVAYGSALEQWVDNENCFGINFPVDLEHLAELITRAIEKDAAGPATARLLDWDDVARMLHEVYVICSENRTPMS
jgi:glycosyltransferase involved in cell wall biosynthesis